MELNAPEAGEKRQRLEKVSSNWVVKRPLRDAAERSLLGAEGQPARNDKNWVGTPMPIGRATRRLRLAERAEISADLITDI